MYVDPETILCFFDVSAMSGRLDVGQILVTWMVRTCYKATVERLPFSLSSSWVRDSVSVALKFVSVLTSVLPTQKCKNIDKNTYTNSILQQSLQFFHPKFSGMESLISDQHPCTNVVLYDLESKPIQNSPRPDITVSWIQ